MEPSGLLTSKVGMATTSVLDTYYYRPVSIAFGSADYAVADVPCLNMPDVPSHV
jgi:hypothetical protein